MLLEEPRIERVRHALKARIPEVVEANPLTPLMHRIVLRSSSFADLVSLGFDDLRQRRSVGLAGDGQSSIVAGC